MATTDELLIELMEKLDARKDNSQAIGKKLLVLSTPRCGSTLFCDVLSNTGKIGDCQEWFNMRYLEAYARMRNQKNIDFNEYLNFILNKTTLDTGIFAVNMHIDQLLSLAKRKINIFDLGFHHMFYLSRKNKLAQAVSLAKAQKTDAWSAKTAGDSMVTLEPSEIWAALRTIIDCEEYFRQNLSSKTQHTFYYESFSTMNATSDYKLACESLGVDANDINFSTKIEKQSKSIENDVLGEFISYLKGELP